MSSKPSGNTNVSGGVEGKSNPMTQSDSARIQSTQATGGKDMSSKGFAAHAQSAGDKNANAGTTKGGSK